MITQGLKKPVPFIAIPVIALLALLISTAAPAQSSNVTITRLLDRPLIGPDIHPSIGENIQGPSLIKVPDWLPNKMGNYYLYFADIRTLHTTRLRRFNHRPLADP